MSIFGFIYRSGGGWLNVSSEPPVILGNGLGGKAEGQRTQQYSMRLPV